MVFRPLHCHTRLHHGFVDNPEHIFFLGGGAEKKAETNVVSSNVRFRRIFKHIFGKKTRISAGKRANKCRLKQRFTAEFPILHEKGGNKRRLKRRYQKQKAHFS